MKVIVDQVYTSVACNRIPEIADWSNDGLICFGATNAVIVYDTTQKAGNPLKVFCHHKSKVNSVKWLRKSDGSCTEFMSCSADKTVAIWTFLEESWVVTSSLKGHENGVTCGHGIYTKGDDLIVYSGSIDSTVKVWERCNGVICLKQTINLNSGLCLSLHGHILPKINQPILFCALDDHKIHLFAGEDYHRVHMLVGHEDWVRGLDVLNIDENGFLLASASQDTYIRLWRIQLYENKELTSEIRVEEKVFSAYGRDWSLKLEAVLAGHEGWVYGVQWHPLSHEKGCGDKIVYRLLSSSLDKTLIIWEPESSEHDSAWVEKVRVGEVGGNGLGFYGSRFGPGGKSFLGHGYNGTFHIWSLNEETRQWVPKVVCGGHYGGVEDTRWEPERGRYLLSVSSDQTTRLHAPWNSGSKQWHEIARPQVHGYDMVSIAPVASSLFASAADEKVLRVFRAPHNFAQNFASITGERLTDGQDAGPEGASVPSLGLSNKAVFNGHSGDDDEKDDGYFVPMLLNEPPTEDTLMQNTLWPEVQKLYGHGYEVYALDASADGSLLASACKATSAEHAAVLIWETTNWQQVQKLVSHQLTVTQLAFSPDSRHLLSVSRDRKWTLYRRAEGSNSFEMAAASDKSNGVHTRIIWCCAWAPDGLLFGTGSRDGKVCMWAETEQESGTSLQRHSLHGKPLELANTSVTALAFAPLTLGTTRVVATGFESGTVRIYSFCIAQWTSLIELDNSAAHHLTVRRLTFNPKYASDDASKETLLASCGADNLVRIHRIIITT